MGGLGRGASHGNRQRAAGVDGDLADLATRDWRELPGPEREAIKSEVRAAKAAFFVGTLARGAVMPTMPTGLTVSNESVAKLRAARIKRTVLPEWAGAVDALARRAPGETSVAGI